MAVACHAEIKKREQMLKKTYIGMIDYNGAAWARIEGADVSKMTGVRGVKRLVLENVKGLQGVLDFRGVNTVVFLNTDVSGIKEILCKTDFNIEGLKGENKISGLMVFEPVGPVDPKAKLISDYICMQMQNKK